MRFRSFARFLESGKEYTWFGFVVYMGLASGERGDRKTVWQVVRACLHVAQILHHMLLIS